jgi:hypothetical protein
MESKIELAEWNAIKTWAMDNGYRYDNSFIVHWRKAGEFVLISEMIKKMQKWQANPDKETFINDLL